jgi:tetrapyrrole methylase family protein/MazG family protein
MATITLVGLGPGDPMLLTRAAWDALCQAEIIYTPVPKHSALAEFAGRVAAAELEDVGMWEHVAIANHARDARDSSAVCCAFPGTPYDWPAKLAMLDGYGCEFRHVAGVSMRDAFTAALNQHGGDLVGSGSIAQVLTIETLLRNPAAAFARPRTSGVSAWCETQGIAEYHPPVVPFPLQPGQPALIWGFTRGTGQHDSHEIFRLRDLLLHVYPAEHVLCLVRVDISNGAAHVQEVSLGELHTHEALISQHSALYVPPISVGKQRRSFDGLHFVAAQLLGPGGCPWDVQQTHQSLRANLLEETYEVLEALDSGDMADLSEELGDLLFQVLVHSEMARQAGHFDMGDVLEQITSKLIRRHPHVFAALAVQDEAEVLRNWERIKAQERASKGRQRSGALDGIPAALPALVAAQKTGSKAARAGFDWPTLGYIWDKLREELEELTHAHQDNERDGSPATQAHLVEELGDTLYVMAQLARWFGLDAESALREASSKFRRRFGHVEQAAQARGCTIHDLSLDEKIALWNDAKR